MPSAVQRADGLGREAALRRVRPALHEQDDAVGCEQGFDARAQGGVEGHGAIRNCWGMRDCRRLCAAGGCGRRAMTAWHHVACRRLAPPAAPPACLGRGACCCRSCAVVAAVVALGLAARAAGDAGLARAVLCGRRCVPDSRLFSPVLRRLPTDEPVRLADHRRRPVRRHPPRCSTCSTRIAAKATFFLVGERAQARPELRARDRAPRPRHRQPQRDASAGLVLGAAAARAMRERDRRARRRPLRELTGVTPRWFRAVVGMANPFVAAVLQRHGLARVAWSARGFDARAARSAARGGAHRATAAPGAIVLLHEGARHGRNVETLALLLQRLDALGIAACCRKSLKRAGHRRCGSDVSRDPHASSRTSLTAAPQLRRHDPPVVERRVAVQRRELATAGPAASNRARRASAFGIALRPGIHPAEHAREHIDARG